MRMKTIGKRVLSFAVALVMMTSLVLAGVPAPAALADYVGDTVTVTRAGNPDDGYTYTINGADAESASVGDFTVTAAEVAFGEGETSATVRPTATLTVTGVTVVRGADGWNTVALPGASAAPAGVTFTGVLSYAAPVGITVDSGTATLAADIASGAHTVEVNCGTNPVGVFTITVVDPAVTDVTVSASPHYYGGAAAGQVATVTVTGTNLYPGIVNVTAAGLTIDAASCDGASVVVPVSFSGTTDYRQFSVSATAQEKSASASFYIDNQGPSGGYFDVLVETDGVTATVTPHGYSDLSGDLASISSGELQVGAPGSTMRLEAIDNCGNSTIVEVPMAQITLADMDAAALDGIEHDGSTYYFNSSNKDRLAIPVTTTVGGMSGFSIGGHTVIGDGSSRHITRYPDGRIEPIAAGATATFGHITYKVSGSTSNTYVIDSVAPTITLTNDVDNNFTQNPAATEIDVRVPSEVVNGEYQTRDVTVTATADDDNLKELTATDVRWVDAGGDGILKYTVTLSGAAREAEIPTGLSARDHAGNATDQNYAQAGAFTLETKTLKAKLLAAPSITLADVPTNGPNAPLSTDHEASATVAAVEDGATIVSKQYAVMADGSTPGTSDWKALGDDGKITVSPDALAADSDTAKIFVRVTDSNGSVTSTASDAFSIDGVAPVIDVVSFDGSYQEDNGVYYFGAAREATVTITELHLENANFTVTGGEITSQTYDEGTHVHTYTVSYANDGACEFSVTAVDRGSHSVTAPDAADLANRAFVIDTTDPVVTLTLSSTLTDGYTNSNDPVTFSLKIVEKNFDEANVDTKVDIPTGWSLSGGNYDTNTYTYTATLSSDTTEGDYYATVSCTDLAGRIGSGTATDTGLDGGKFVIDRTPPVVNVTLPDSGYEGIGGGRYYGGAVVATVTITEKNFSASTVTPPTGYQFDANDWTPVEGQPDQYTNTITFTDEQRYTGLEVGCQDKVNAPASGAIASFAIDLTAPEIHVALPQASAEAGVMKYYSRETDGTVVATVEITEQFFDELQITPPTGFDFDSPTWTSAGTNKYTNTVTFTAEDEYTGLSVSCKDATHPVQSDSLDSFTIDKTDPVVELTFDETKVKGTDTEGESTIRYFNDENVDITVTVTEKNFDPTKVTATTGTFVNETWTQDGDKHTNTLRITTAENQETKYSTVTVSVEDLATRTGEKTAEAFVVDRHNPVVEMAVDAAGCFMRVGSERVFLELDEDAAVQDDPDKIQAGKTGQDAWTKTFNTEDTSLTEAERQAELERKNAYINKQFTVTYALTDSYVDWTTVSLKLNDTDVTATATVNQDNKTVSYTFTASTESAATYKFDFYAADKATNKAGENDVIGTVGGDGFIPSVANGTVSATFAIDRQQPSGQIDSSAPSILISVPDAPPSEIYTEDVPFTVKVTDGAIGATDANSGLKVVEFAVSNGSVSADSTDNASIQTYYDTELNGDRVVGAELSRTIKLTPADGENANVRLVVTATDQAGNIRVGYKSVSIDELAPRVSYSIDKASVLNNEYYNAERTATITVKDVNLKSGYVDVTGKPAAYSVKKEFTANNGETEVTIEVPFPGPEVEYAVAIHAEDAAGHTTDGNKDAQTEKLTVTGTNPWHFYVDTKAPVLTVAFDNNDVRNGKYYKAARTATLQITESFFDPNLIRVDGAPNPAWGGTAPSFSASLGFDADGTYQFQVSGTDLAGNPLNNYDSQEFVIDRTMPKVEISNIEDHSANRGAVEPIVTFSDNNFDNAGYTVTVTKIINLTDHTTVELPHSTSNIANGVVLNFADLPHTLENDGIYTMIAQITDLAGNTSEAQVTFSVNRKGSTYYAYDDPTRDLLSRFYSNAAPTLRIAEINPDQLKEYSVTVSVNNRSRKLTEGVDFTVEHTGGKDSFNQYIYTVDKSVFLDGEELIEGAYTLVFNSTDNAGNLNSNRDNENSLAVNFILDKTPPVISYVGVADGDRIKAESRDVTVYFDDSFGVARVEVVLNGQVIKVLEGEELRDANGEYTFTVQQASRRQSLAFTAVDAAGNLFEMDEIHFYLNNSALGQFFHNTPLLVITVAALGGVAGAIVAIKRRGRKEDAVEET